MTQREKKLVLIMGGALGLLGAWKGVMATIVEPRHALIEEREKLRDRKTKLEDRLLGQAVVERNWETHTLRTLATSDKPDAAANALHLDVVRLLQKNSLPEKGVQDRDKAAPSTGNKNYRKDFYELRVVVDTEGTIDHLIAFLQDVYNLGYYVSVERLGLGPKEGE